MGNLTRSYADARIELRIIARFCAANVLCQIEPQPRVAPSQDDPPLRADVSFHKSAGFREL